ncbi:hypothetical protein B0H14DRAFT_2725206 [Mycena olivaceomarginata]|nr:hypothetical protein B0H14DRAFT_2725206 [Mycena olivaceomarginata]
MASSLLLLLSYMSVLAHAVLLPSHYTSISRDVVVLGGGSSGTYAAVKLVARGRSVVVLDQKGRLGGHVETYIDAKGVPHNVGVTVYYNNTINNAYFSLLGVPTGPVAFAPTGRVFLDLATGKTVPCFDPVSQVDSFIPAMLAYAAYVNTTYPYLTLSYENLPYPLPSELLDPFTVFAARHNFTAMLQFFNGLAQNIGNLWELPTYQGIHAVNPKLVDAFLKGFINAASGDNQDIYNAAAAYLGPENVFLNSTILDVDRSGACFGVQETAGSGICVLSTSPSLSSSANVTTLIKARKLLVAIPPLPSTYNNIGAHTPYNLLTLPGAFSYSPLPAGRFTSWFGAFEDHGFLDDDVEALIRGEIRRMVAHGTAAGNPNDVTFEFLKIHAPFRLTPSAHDVANGAYKDLYALEGRRNTFWDGSQIWWWSELSLLPKMEAALRAR